MFLAREIRGPLRLLNKRAMRKRAAEIMSRLAVDVPLDVPVHRLSVAQQQFVEIAKALSLDARILVLDEPTATLTPSETEHLFKVMRELRRQGVAIIFISHHLEEIFEICDRITVLRDGELIGSCLTTDVDNDRLVEMMVGRRIEANFPPKPKIDTAARNVIEVEELQLKKAGRSRALPCGRVRYSVLPGLSVPGARKRCWPCLARIPLRAARSRSMASRPAFPARMRR